VGIGVLVGWGVFVEGKVEAGNDVAVMVINRLVEVLQPDMNTIAMKITGMKRKPLFMLCSIGLSGYLDVLVKRAQRLALAAGGQGKTRLAG
jgi:hypothetical protein